MIEGLLGGIGQGLSNFMGGFGGGGGANMPGVTDDERKYLQQQSMQNFGRMLMVLGQQMTPAQRAQAMSQMAGNMPDPTQQLARMQEMKLNQLKMEQYKKQQEGLANFGNILKQDAQVVETPVPGAAPQQRVPTSGEEARAPLAPITPTQQKLVSPLPGITGEQYQFLRTFGNDPAAAQEMYQKLAIENMKGGEKPPADVQEYNFYRQQEISNGRQPMSWLDYQKALKKEGASSTQIMMPGGPSAEAEALKELEKRDGALMGTYLEKADQSGAMLQDMELLTALIQDPSTPQGPLTGRLAQLFPGLNSKAAAFDSIINRVAPNMRAPGSGSTSDIEFAGFLKSLPSLSNRPDANMIITTVFKEKAAIDQARADIVRRYQDGKITAAQRREMISELNKQSILAPELRSLINGADSGSGAVKPGKYKFDPATGEMVPE